MSFPFFLFRNNGPHLLLHFNLLKNFSYSVPSLKNILEKRCKDNASYLCYKIFITFFLKYFFYPFSPSKPRP